MSVGSAGDVPWCGACSRTLLPRLLARSAAAHICRDVYVSQLPDGSIDLADTLPAGRHRLVTIVTLLLQVRQR